VIQVTSTGNSTNEIDNDKHIKNEIEKVVTIKRNNNTKQVRNENKTRSERKATSDISETLSIQQEKSSVKVKLPSSISDTHSSRSSSRSSRCSSPAPNDSSPHLSPNNSLAPLPPSSKKAHHKRPKKPVVVNLPGLQTLQNEPPKDPLVVGVINLPSIPENIKDIIQKHGTLCDMPGGEYKGLARLKSIRYAEQRERRRKLHHERKPPVLEKPPTPVFNECLEDVNICDDPQTTESFSMDDNEKSASSSGISSKTVHTLDPPLTSKDKILGWRLAVYQETFLNPENEIV